MAFLAGDRVHLAGLGTGTVREVRSGGRYAIDLKGRMVIAREGDLEAAEPPRRSRRPHSEGAAPVDDPLPATRTSPSLDLHGKTTAEAIDALDGFISDALLAGHADVRVIHGVSGGKVKAAVHQRLRQLTSIRAFHIDPRNAGVTIVSFD